MTLEEAIAEVRIDLAHEDAVCEDTVATILNAAASGDLIPNSDHRLAVALAVQKAGDALRNIVAAHKAEGRSPGTYPRLDEHTIATILALADQDALAEVQALKEALSHWIDEAFAKSRSAEAAEAEVARLREALNAIEKMETACANSTVRNMANHARAALQETKP